MLRHANPRDDSTSRYTIHNIQFTIAAPAYSTASTSDTARQSRAAAIYDPRGMIWGAEVHIMHIESAENVYVIKKSNIFPSQQIIHKPFI